MGKILHNKYFVFISFTAIGAITWININSFFWRDDWLYLFFYQQSEHLFLKGHIASDIKPLFQYWLYPQFYLFENSFAAYQIVNVILLICCAITLFIALRNFDISPAWSLVGGLFFLLHPTNFVNVLWIFQQCELVHILLLLICLVLYQNIRNNDSYFFIALFSMSMCAQNYIFPNGTFYPIMFIAIEIIFPTRLERNKPFIYSNLIIFILNLCYTYAIQDLLKLPGQGINIFSNIPEKIFFFLSFISNSLGRTFIPNFSLTSSLLLNLTPLIIFVFLIIVTYKRSVFNNLLQISIWGILFSSITITLTRYSNTDIPYYYTSLHLPFIILSLIAVIQGLNLKRVMTITLQIAALGVFTGFIALDFWARQIFSTRNKANFRQMELSLTNNTPYQPVDDPAIEIDQFIPVKGHNSKESVVQLYQEMLKKD